MSETVPRAPRPVPGPALRLENDDTVAAAWVFGSGRCGGGAGLNLPSTDVAYDWLELAEDLEAEGWVPNSPK